MSDASPTPPARQGLLTRRVLVGGAIALALTTAAALAARQLDGDSGRRTASSASPGASAGSSPAPSSPGPSASAAEEAVTVVAVGDIACPRSMPVGRECRQDDTSRLAQGLVPDAVLALGDLVYPGESPVGFEQDYDPSWGALKEITYPAIGNHEYHHPKAEPYFRYWGERAGPGWYSFDLGGWHLVSLNSNCETVGCGPDSEQGRWLAADLAADAARRPGGCTLAFSHHPRFTSGFRGPFLAAVPLYDAARAAGVDLLLSGHDHHYERFAPMDGPRQLIVGTGGRSLYPALPQQEGSEVRLATSYGVLALDLFAGRYAWRFVDTDGEVLDRGTDTCR